MMRNTIGTICDPHTAWMLLRSMETVELRMSRAGENAEKVCAWLREHPKVDGLGYLGFLPEQFARSLHCTDRLRAIAPECFKVASRISAITRSGAISPLIATFVERLLPDGDPVRAPTRLSA